jgi:hypothetical protein
MSRLVKFLVVAVLALFILACGLISNPISDIEIVALTAEAYASQMPLTTVEALATNLPVQTIEAFPSMFPDVGNYFDPTGTPVDQWKGIPVMPQAIVGEEVGETTYSYTVPASATDVQTYYNENMPELGWNSSISLPVSEDGGILVYQRENEFVTITIVRDLNDSNSVDVLLQR